MNRSYLLVVNPLSLLILLLCTISFDSQAKVNQTAMARVMSCIGECFIVRGEKFHKVSFRSAILPGDEFLTRDGRAWLSLYGGAIVRVSPHTQIVPLEFSSEKALWRLNKALFFLGLIRIFTRA